MIMLFMVVYSWTLAPVDWLYAAETTIDPGLGVIFFTHQITLLSFITVIPSMMDNAGPIGSKATFLTMGIISAIGGVFGYIYMKETSFLTDYGKSILLTHSRAGSLVTGTRVSKASIK